MPEPCASDLQMGRSRVCVSAHPHPHTHPSRLTQDQQARVDMPEGEFKVREGRPIQWSDISYDEHKSWKSKSLGHWRGEATGICHVCFKNLSEHIDRDHMRRIMESFGELREAHLNMDELNTTSLGSRFVMYLSVEQANFRYIDVDDARNVVKWLRPTGI